MTKIFGHLLLLCALALHSLPARAENILTEEAIRAYYKKVSDIYKGDYPGYVAYLQTHIHDRFEGIAVSTVTLPGQAPVESSERVGKKEMLATSRRDYDAMQGASLVNEIREIKISPDGKSAFVVDYTTVNNIRMPLPGNDGMGLIMTGSGPCHDVVIVNDMNVIQTTQSSCQVSMTVGQEQEL